MPFPNKVKEQAFISSGRHCVLCHKYCGIKIEAHHIKPHSKGGEDTLDNCIPLCFDCHCEVGSYNSEHPKGNKFSESELIAHRDNWYNRISNNDGYYKISYKNTDLKTFETINEFIPIELIDIFRNQDFGNSFYNNILSTMDRIIFRFENRPGDEFLDTELEGIRAEILMDIKKFAIMILEYTDCREGNMDLNYIPFDEMTLLQNREATNIYRERRNEMNELSTHIAVRYDDLIRLARRKLYD